jgi:lysophospholipase L1-like esterase
MLVRFRQDVVSIHPEAVLILAGTNDLAGITGAISVEAIFGNIVSMAEIAKAGGIRVILSSVLPVYDYLCCPGMEPVEKIKRLNKLLQEYADKNELSYIDFYTKMEDGVGGMQSTLSEDGLHPNGKGYEIMTQLAEQAIKQIIR